MISDAPGRRIRVLLLSGTMLCLVTGCRTGLNYEDPKGPGSRAFSPGPHPCAPRLSDTLRVVSFNVEFALNVEGAADLLTTHPDLRCADILLVQEMDERGTRILAEALDAAFAYYPAVFHLKYERDFGNAVLSRWPILDDEKLILPHLAHATRTQRTATAATLLIRGDTVRAYSAHLGTMLEIGPSARRDQLLTVLVDATRYTHVVLGGDMNSGGVGEVVSDAGFDWPTREGPPTLGLGRRWDHIFTKGLEFPVTRPSGTVGDPEGASDHKPVWIRGMLVNTRDGRDAP